MTESAGSSSNGMTPGTFVHCVYFWLKDDISAVALTLFTEGLASLIGIETVRQGYYGTPAGTDRAIIDRSYSYALVIAFDDAAAHEVYQEHSTHDAFRNECGHLWTDVKIYDFTVG